MYRCRRRRRSPRRHPRFRRRGSGAPGGCAARSSRYAEFPRCCRTWTARRRGTCIADFERIDCVPARRAINSVGHGRGPVDEILVRSFDYPVVDFLVGAPRDEFSERGYGTGRPRRRSCGPVDGVTPSEKYGGKGRERQDAPGLFALSGLASGRRRGRAILRAWCRSCVLSSLAVVIAVAVLGVAAYDQRLRAQGVRSG